MALDTLPASARDQLIRPKKPFQSHAFTNNIPFSTEEGGNHQTVIIGIVTSYPILSSPSLPPALRTGGYLASAVRHLIHVALWSIDVIFIRGGGHASTIDPTRVSGTQRPLTLLLLTTVRTTTNNVSQEWW